MKSITLTTGQALDWLADWSGQLECRQDKGSGLGHILEVGSHHASLEFLWNLRVFEKHQDMFLYNEKLDLRISINTQFEFELTYDPSRMGQA